MTSPSILIVGAGPTGLTMAAALARQGVRARIIDRNEGPVQESRAIAIQPRTLELFDQLGIVDEFLARGVWLKSLDLHGQDKQQIARIVFQDLPSRYPAILSLPQSDTETLLGDHVQQQGIAIERQVELVSFADRGGCVECVLRHSDGRSEDANFDWVVGCDGAHSIVRSGGGFTFEGHEFPQHFVLADMKLDTELTNAQLFASSEGLMALFPIPSGRVRLIATAEAPPTPPDSHTPGPTLADCQAIVQDRGPGGWKVIDLKWSSSFRIHSRMVACLRIGRLFVAGDAAHIHSPAMGQGMNTGIQDAMNLAWKLALVAKGAADPKLLDSYEAERLPVIRQVLRETEITTHVAAASPGVATWLRDHLLPHVSHLGAMQHFIGLLVSELGIAYRQSRIVLDRGEGEGPRAGERAPDGIAHTEGGEKRLFEMLRESGHHAIVLGDPSVEEVEDLDLLMQELLPGECCLHTVGVVNALGDNEDPPYGTDDSLFLIRPDGYIGLRADWDEREAGVRQYISSLLTT